MSDLLNYEDAVKIIKSAILQSQYVAIKSVNESQLVLYFYIGKYISINTREKRWGQGAIDIIAQRLETEMPGLRGFKARNLRYMRSFYEEWTFLDGGTDFALTSAKSEEGGNLPILHLQVQNYDEFPLNDFLAIGFTQHRNIIESVKYMSDELLAALPDIEDLKKIISDDE